MKRSTFRDALEKPRQTRAMKPILTLLTALLLAPLAALHAADRPNIIVILADDFGYGSAGCYGANPALVRTPNIDRLAKEGRRFTDANTTSSVCSPTRYSVVTGRYCWRTSLKHEVLSTFAPLHVETTRLTVASLLKKRGYATAAVGKWHLGYGTADGSPKWRTDSRGVGQGGSGGTAFDGVGGLPEGCLPRVVLDDAQVLPGCGGLPHQPRPTE
jgi:hypothetical protein